MAIKSKQKKDYTALHSDINKVDGVVKCDINSKKGIMLDIGCGDSKQKGFVGLDVRDLDNVDIVWDMEKFPYPLPDECCLSILASHVVEHINPARFGFVNAMNEWWRIMKPGGRLMINMPYGISRGFLQDPTHCNPRNETTWGYFDPTHRDGLYVIYRPKPWKIILNSWSIDGNMEVVLEKIPEEEVKIEEGKIIVNARWVNVNTKLRNSDKG